jgi:hypothetical protein
MRYSHLRVDLFGEASYSRVRVDFTRPAQENVIQMAPKPAIEIKLRSGTAEDDKRTTGKVALLFSSAP